jgi:hypothetical protein
VQAGVCEDECAHGALQVVPSCSLLLDKGNKKADHVQHEQPEPWEDMLSFGEHFDTAHAIEMQLAQQLAGVGKNVSDSIGHEEAEIVDEDSGGDW